MLARALSEKRAIRLTIIILAVLPALPLSAPKAAGKIVPSYLGRIQENTPRSEAEEVAQLASRLDSSDEQERIDAAVKLAMLGTPLAIPALTSALDDREERVRAIAIDGLVMIGDPQVLPLLTNRLERDRSVFVRKSAAYAIGRLGSRLGTPALLAALKDKNAELRGAAVVALSKYRDPAAVPGLIQALSDKDSFVRAHAALALGNNGRAAIQATPHLIRLLDSDPSNEVKREAATALGYIGDPSALESLERAKLSSDYLLSQAALSAIKRIRESRES
ncbi:MAG TPA: HEAT repeat domain-containing protein [Blastocatellia bacterium]|nr:HEAT repeat domain-containing protein [Blastocatellia bacterium]